MAIKLPDPGNGIPEQKTGNDEWTNMKIVRDNFADQTHAASRLVGTEKGNVMEVGAFGIGGNAIIIGAPNSVAEYHTAAGGGAFFTNAPNLKLSPYNQTDIMPPYSTYLAANLANGGFFAIGAKASDNHVFVIRGEATDARYPLVKMTLYHDKNTTKEEGTGYLVASSPVLKMQHDSFEKVHEAEQLDIEVKNIKTGVYEITGTTGLRENDGWKLKPPKDVNGNVLCICEASESNGVITLKTYKKKFDFETVSIVADYEQPTDIPEGAVVMLRFNDLPQEQLDEPIE